MVTNLMNYRRRFLGIVFAGLFLFMVGAPMLITHKAAAASCSPANVYSCTTPGACTNAGGEYMPGGKGCVPDSKKCNNENAGNCETESDCDAAQGLWQAGICHQTSPSPSPSPSGNSTSGSGTCSAPSFFGLVPWYKYLPKHVDNTTGRCEINQSETNNVLGKKSFILLIVLAIVDDLLRIAGLVAVVFMIIGGFKLMTSQGNPEALAGARKTMMFALVGLVVAIIAVVIVSFIGNSIGK